jgi:hypothetical protein
MGIGLAFGPLLGGLLARDLSAQSAGRVADLYRRLEDGAWDA